MPMWRFNRIYYTFLISAPNIIKKIPAVRNTGHELLPIASNKIAPAIQSAPPPYPIAWILMLIGTQVLHKYLMFIYFLLDSMLKTFVLRAKASQ